MDEAMNTVRNILAAAAVAVMVVPAAGTASADPTSSPSPGYQVPTSGGGVVLPGTQVYPPRCFRNMLGCGLRYYPGSGTWQPVEGAQ
jgi:hypothetical protein